MAREMQLHIEISLEFGWSLLGLKVDVIQNVQCSFGMDRRQTS
jgi:hypothetical protein